MTAESLAELSVAQGSFAHKRQLTASRLLGCHQQVKVDGQSSKTLEQIFYLFVAQLVFGCKVVKRVIEALALKAAVKTLFGHLIFPRACAKELVLNEFVPVCLRV